MFYLEQLLFSVIKRLFGLRSTTIIFINQFVCLLGKNYCSSRFTKNSKIMFRASKDLE
jgi:hypothetical protein